MTSELIGVSDAQESESTTNHTQTTKTKIDPITAVQDSIDSLALSLFEALRGVRDAVAPEYLEDVVSQPSSSTTKPVVPLSAFKDKDDIDELDAKNVSSAKELLLHGLNMEYFPPRAFDLLEPDYESFIMTYLNDNPYAKELVERFDNSDKDDVESEKVDDDKQFAATSAAGNLDGTVESAKESDKLTKPKLGEVGYELRKKFDSGWYIGKITDIKPLAENGYDRRCIYSDGDIEDLRVEDLERLAKLDPNNNKTKPRLSIKLSAKSKQPTDSRVDTNPTSNGGNVKFPLTQAEYTKLLLDTEHQRDVQTTQILAKDILAKSADVDELVAKLPGMDRTRDMQMERINELIKENHAVTKELEEAYAVANKRREEVRVALGESTCLALGVEEE